jgi:AcrR family transcriptional regulator
MEQCSIYQLEKEFRLVIGSEHIQTALGGSAERPLRADARRNENALLDAAKQVFSEVGVDAPVREIASRAGVGLGTLYRRFPKRSDLIAAVFSRELETCAGAATALACQHAPFEALTLWLKRYSAFMTTKKGLSAALHSGDPAFDALPDYFRCQLEPALHGLLHASVASGDVREGIDSYDLLRAIGNLSTTTGDDSTAHTDRMVNLLIAGLRYGADQF